MRLRNLDSGPFHAPAIVEPTTIVGSREIPGKVLFPAFVIGPGETFEPTEDHEDALRAHHIIDSRTKPQAGSLNGKTVRLLSWERSDKEDAPPSRLAMLEADARRASEDARQAAGERDAAVARSRELEAQLAALALKSAGDTKSGDVKSDDAAKAADKASKKS